MVERNQPAGVFGGGDGGGGGGVGRVIGWKASGLGTYATKIDAASDNTKYYGSANASNYGRTYSQEQFQHRVG